MKVRSVGGHRVSGLGDNEYQKTPRGGKVHTGKVRSVKVKPVRTSGLKLRKGKRQGKRGF